MYGVTCFCLFMFFFSSRRRHTRFSRDWSSDVCSSDLSDTEAFINPFMVLYAIHDALVKPMPGGDNTPSLAESWSVSRDGLTYEFVLRKGVKFHNGDPVTAEDVKFSFDRYKGAAAKLLKERVREVQIVDPARVRFVLKDPWPDFMTFYGTSATGARSEE